jgi:hypothetical protein
MQDYLSLNIIQNTISTLTSKQLLILKLEDLGDTLYIHAPSMNLIKHVKEDNLSFHVAKIIFVKCLQSRKYLP